jgi:hypothetical protein
LYSYFYLKLAETLCNSFYVFSSTKSENRRVEQILPGVGVLAPVGVERKHGMEWEDESVENVATCM